MKFAAKIEQTAKDCFEVSFPDKDNAFTFGSSLKEALRMAKDCIETALEADLENGIPVQEPKTQARGKNMHAIEIDAKLAKACKVFNTNQGLQAYATLSGIASILGRSLKVEFASSNTMIAR